MAEQVFKSPGFYTEQSYNHAPWKPYRQALQKISINNSTNEHWMKEITKSSRKNRIRIIKTRDQVQFFCFDSNFN